MRLPDGKKTWLVLGAGVSVRSPSSVPLWNTIKRKSLQAVAEVLMDLNERKWRNEDSRYDFRAVRDLLANTIYPEIVLENLTHSFGRNTVADALSLVIEDQARPLHPNCCHRAVAALCAQGRISGIITPNFDRLLEVALSEREVHYEVVIDSARMTAGVPIFKVHGSIENAKSLSFMRHEYFRGLPPEVERRLREDVRNSLVLICGYSGWDVDLFPLLRDLITYAEMGNRAIVVDTRTIEDNVRFFTIRSKLEYVQADAGGVLADLAKLSVEDTQCAPEDVDNGYLLPSRDAFACAVFLAESLMGVSSYEAAYRYFFLAQDIAEDEGNWGKLSIALFGKAVAMFRMGENETAEVDYGWGRYVLAEVLRRCSTLDERRATKFGASLTALRDSSSGHRLGGGFVYAQGEDFLTADPREPWMPEPSLEQLDNLLLWEFRARSAAALALLQAAEHTEEDETRVRLLESSGQLFHGLDEWECEFSDAESSQSQIAWHPRIYGLLTRGYQLTVAGDPRAVVLLKACQDLCRKKGFFEEMLLAGHLLAKAGAGPDQNAKNAQQETLMYLGWKDDHVAASLVRPSKPFMLRFHQYQPCPVRKKHERSFGVQHIAGVVGQNENVVEEHTVSAPSALDAILAVVPVGHATTWNRLASTDLAAGLFNPSASTREDEYCDYWFAKVLE
jgi:hypothetical protein